MTEEEIQALKDQLAKAEADKVAAEEKAAAYKDEQQKLASEKSELAKQVQSLTAEVKKDKLPEFDVEEDKYNDIEGGKYDFTCPTFTWDDNSIIDVRELMVDAEGEDTKAAEKAQAILAALVARKSGIIKRREE